MLDYKVEYDENTKKISIHWFDKDGNEVEGEAGTYRITIPANSFVWHGDGVNCEGKEGNDEFIYTFTIASDAPKPIINAKMKDNQVYFIIDNSATDATEKSLGYHTQGELFENCVMCDRPLEIDNIAYIPDYNVRQFGYNEPKCLVYYNLKEGFHYQPDQVYTLTMISECVYNQGDGSLYSKKKVYNDDYKFQFTGTTQPKVAVSASTYDNSTKKLTIVYKLTDTDINADDDLPYWSDIQPNAKPFITNKDGSATAYCESTTVSEEDDSIVTCVFSIKDDSDFFIEGQSFTSGTSIGGTMDRFYFSVNTNADWIKNKGDGEKMVGIIGNDYRTDVVCFESLKQVPTPVVRAINNSTSKLTVYWDNIDGLTYDTDKDNSLVSFYTFKKDGTRVNLNKYKTVIFSGNSTNVIYDTTDNFGLDEDVDQYYLTIQQGHMTNVGDNIHTSGTAQNESRTFTYKPVDCRPSADLIKTNVSPLYPILDGNKLDPLHSYEITTFEDGSITIEDTSGNLLMAWSTNDDFVNVDSSSMQVYQPIEDLSSNEISAYTSGDDVYFSTSPMYSANGLYEKYYGNKIKLKVYPYKFYTQGDGITSLGYMSGVTDTLSIDKYVLEVGLDSDSSTAYSPVKNYVAMTANTFASIVDWNTDNITKSDEIPTYVGSELWCNFSSGTENIVFDDGYYYNSTYDNMKYAFGYVWAQTLINQTTSEALKQSVKDNIGSYYETVYNRIKYQDIFDEWVNAYFIDNPITFTGTTGGEDSAWNYSDYPVNLTYDKAKFLRDDFTLYLRSQIVNNSFSMYNMYGTSDNTYSFLYDNPAKCWRLGLFDIPYNDNKAESMTIPITDVYKIDTSNQSDFSYFLYNQGKLHSVKAKLDLDKAKVCNYMFAHCWCENESNKNLFFDGTLNTTSDLANVVSAVSMFDGCENLTGLNNSFTFKNLKYADYMLNDCRCLRGLGPNFNPTGLLSANYMFAVNGMNVGTGVRFFDENGIYVDYIKNCHTPTSPINYDKDTKEFWIDDYSGEHTGHNNITVYAESAFTMTTVPNTFKSVETIQSANGMFYRRSNLVSVPAFWNFKSLTTAEEMFASCSSLISIPTGWTDTYNLTDAGNMFSYCTSLTGTTAGFTCENLKNARAMFACCTLKNLNNAFAPNKLENSSAMFMDCANLENIPTGWTSIDTIQQSQSMFARCSSLTALPSSWILCETTDVRNMFEGCTSLYTVDIEFPNVSDYSAMLYDSSVTAITKPINIGSAKHNTDKSYQFLGTKTYEFYIEDIGKTENLRTSYTNKAEVVFSLLGLETPTTDTEKETLAKSFMYACDHAWSGVTIPNSDSYSATTSDRSVASKDCCIYLSKDTWDAIRPYLLEHYTECNQFGQDIIKPRLDAGDKTIYDTINAYYIAWYVG